MVPPRQSAWQPTCARLSTITCAFPSRADGPGLPGVACRCRREHPLDKLASKLWRAVRWRQPQCAPLTISGGEPALAMTVGARTRRAHSDCAARLHA